jgi:hypothetical protein
MRVVMEYARAERADMVSLLPRMHCESFWGRVVLPLSGFVVLVHFPLWKVNDDADRTVAFANGQYLLVRRGVYEAVGGFASVRDQFVEDVGLARRVKTLGFRLRVASGLHISTTRMYTSLGELVKAWSRMVYAAADYKAAKLVYGIGIICSLSVSAYAMVVVILSAIVLGVNGWFLQVLVVMMLGHVVTMFSVLNSIYALGGHDRRHLPWYGLACLVMLCVLGTALRTTFTRRVMWRGVIYRRVGSSEIGNTMTSPTRQ